MASKLNILVVEDHHDLRRLTVDLLCAAGHNADGVASAEDVNDKASRDHPDLYVLDLNLPGEDGLSLARRLRRAHPQAGIIMVTVRGALGQRIAGYADGADLYLAKPVEPEELLAAVEALGRRLGTTAAEAPAVQVDKRRLQLRGPRGEADLTQGEVALLGAFAAAPGQSLETWQVASRVGLGLDNLNKNALEARLAQLRKKLAQVGCEGPSIKALRGVGYRFCLPLQLI